MSARDIPGVHINPDREFVYVELKPTPRSQDVKKLSKLVDALFDNIQQLLHAANERGTSPRDGALLEELAVLQTPSGQFFAGFSYRGDLPGWRRVLEEYGAAHGCFIAVVENTELPLPDERIPLDQCKVYFI